MRAEPPHREDHREGAESSLCSLWQEFTIPYRFPVTFTRGAFYPENRALAEALFTADGPPPLFPVADEGVAALDPTLGRRLEAYAAAHRSAVRLVAPLHVLPGGEQSKEGGWLVQKLHLLFLEYQLCRHSVVVAIGGGAFLDVVGYAAATAHRGIRLVRMPTTTLAQNDAGVGVKNGYNSFGRKNWIGTFAPPFAVINDFDFLRTLPPRYCRSGMAEAVKVAVIKDAAFFGFLSAQRASLARLSPPHVEAMIVRCARLHMAHTADGDPFEVGSARPLDFGHWCAHALEDRLGGEILHGEAVAIGMALDACYARETGFLPADDQEQIVTLLQDLGFTVAHPALARIDLAEALAQFRQHLGGRLSVTLPAGIGRSEEVHDMDLSLLHRCREWLLSLPSRG